MLVQPNQKRELFIETNVTCHKRDKPRNAKKTLRYDANG